MSRQDAIANLMPVFRHYGYEGATLSRLSQATGLGRASLYHHFPGGKQEMATEVLEQMNQLLDQTALQPLRQAEVDPRHRLEQMCATVAEFYQQGQEACLLSILTLGEAGDRFQGSVQAAMALWIETLAQTLIEAGVAPELARERAEDALIQIQGALVVVRGLGDSRPFQRVMDRLPQQLLTGSAPE